MTYFGNFNFWLLFLNLKLICPGIRKNHETYVAGGCSKLIFLQTAPGLEGTPQEGSPLLKPTPDCHHVLTGLPKLRRRPFDGPAEF